MQESGNPAMEQIVLGEGMDYGCAPIFFSQPWILDFNRHAKHGWLEWFVLLKTQRDVQYDFSHIWKDQNKSTAGLVDHDQCMNIFDSDWNIERIIGPELKNYSLGFKFWPSKQSLTVKNVISQ